MVDFGFKRASRKCSVSGRAFSSGEEYVSCLIDQDGEMIRQDIAIENWKQPPENCLAWWKAHVPNLETGKVYWAPKDVLLSYFQHLIDSDARESIYVMAVLLTQKKYFRLLDTVQQDGQEIMQVMCNTTKEKYDIDVVPISADGIEQIQQELAEKLFTDVAPVDE